MKKIIEMLDKQVAELEKQLSEPILTGEDFWLPRRDYEAEAKRDEAEKLLENGCIL
jgi:hypothetical protein